MTLLLLALWPAAGAGEPAIPDAERTYAVVASDAVMADGQWAAVVDALVRKHRARIVRYAVDVESVVPELSALKPDLIALVVRPQDAGRQFVVHVHRLTRRLDDDPYTDALWGIVTGYEAADALRMVERTEPLHIRRGASGAGVGHLAPFADGFASHEGTSNGFWIKNAGTVTQERVEPDAAKALAGAFNTLVPQVFCTSGHATDKDWQIGFGFPGGQFRCDRGQLYALNSKDERVDINSPEPKVYLPMGNCLIGHISGPDCMATAWMHTGGVYQMFGYTAVTWFGYMGWGTAELFGSGRLDLAESFFFINQALIHTLATRYPERSSVAFETYDEQAIDYLVSRHGLVRPGADGKPEFDKEPAGLLWDRDIVAFYGDPAWEARMPRQEPAWRAGFSAAGPGRTAFTVTTLKDGSWPSHPIMAWLPERLQGPTVVAGADVKPVITDNFILVPLSGAFKAGVEVRIVFAGTRLVRPDAGALAELQDFKARVAGLATGDGPVLLDALLRAGSNRRSLLEALERLTGEARGGLAFLIVNMPPQDLQVMSGERLAEEVALAYRARDGAPWKAIIPPDIFLNDVLAYASLDEARGSWRKDLFERFRARAWACRSPGEAAVKLNAGMFPELNVRYHATRRPRPNQDPAESIQAGFASCTGLSILLVDACRACGIPARIAGIPAWKDGKGDEQGRHGGNHSWVEIWDGRWHHLGAAEPSELDQAWFTGKTRGPAVDPTNPSHRIYASSFRRTGLGFPLPWAPEVDWVSAVDVTRAYQAP